MSKKEITKDGASHELSKKKVEGGKKPKVEKKTQVMKEIEQKGIKGDIKVNKTQSIKNKQTLEDIKRELELNLRKEFETHIKRLEKNLAHKTKLTNQYFEYIKRLQADFANYRARVEKERLDVVTFANEKLVISLLDVLDNFERAFQSVKKTDTVESVIAGFRLIFNQLHTLLEKEGLRPIKCVGEIFDPTQHHAVMRVKRSDCPENTIIEELKKGYYLKSKIIRPSMVKVAIK
jgi:molecular chaperone GrpE